MKVKNIISVADLNSTEIKGLIDKAVKWKHEVAPQTLSQKVIALIFEKPSLRTRTSFEIAIHQLGGYCLYLSPDEVGLGKREPVADIAQVLGRYVNGIIARTFSHRTLETLAQWSGVPVINALSDVEHPCQALADILTIYEHKNKLHGLNLAYLGDGNNVAHSLLLAATLTGINFRIASPKGYEVQPEILQAAKAYAADADSQIMLTEDPKLAATEADIIYTDVWTSMGQETEREQRISVFSSYQVNNNLLKLADNNVIIMHPLPAHHGEEIEEGLLNHPNSVVFDQAENRLHMQKAILVEIFHDSGRDK